MNVILHTIYFTVGAVIGRSAVRGVAKTRRDDNPGEWVVEGIESTVVFFVVALLWPLAVIALFGRWIGR